MAISRGVGRYGTVLVAVGLLLAACGSDDGGTQAAAPAAPTEGDRPTVVVTTNILGDVMDELIGDQADVITIMPVGADPHDFQPSAQEVDQILEADALIVNGSDFEEGLIDVIESASESGVPTFEATSSVETIEFGAGGHDEHEDEHGDEEHDGEDGDEEHSDEEHGDEEEHADEDEHEDEHGHDGADPHFFTDPTRMADAVEGVAAFLTAEVDGLDIDAVEAAVAAYTAELEALDAEIAALVETIPSERRVLVTNHEVFGYFADRYGFEVVGTVIPGGTTVESASAGELVALVEVIESEGVPAIFTDVSASSALAETLAAEVGDVDIVELYTESLGEADSDGATYLEMVRSNASRISAALG